MRKLIDKPKQLELDMSVPRDDRAHSVEIAVSLAQNGRTATEAIEFLERQLANAEVTARSQWREACRQAIYARLPQPTFKKSPSMKTALMALEVLKAKTGGF